MHIHYKKLKELQLHEFQMPQVIIKSVWACFNCFETYHEILFLDWQQFFWQTV